MAVRKVRGRGRVLNAKNAGVLKGYALRRTVGP